MYVNDTLDENRNGKSIYIVYKDGSEEQVSVSNILKKS
jgi:hypothetical protein